MHIVNLSQNQLIATVTALELFLEDCEREEHHGSNPIDPSFKKGVEQTIKKLEKEYKKLQK